MFSTPLSVPQRRTSLGTPEPQHAYQTTFHTVLRTWGTLLCCLLLLLPASAQLYVHSVTSSKDFGTFDLTTKTYTSIGTTSVILWDIAFDPNGILYGIEASNGNLYKVSTTDASLTLVAKLGVKVNAMTFREDGALFVAGNSSLFRVTLPVGTTTYLGDFTGYTSSGDLAFDLDNNLYLSTTSNDLIRLNPDTGAATLVGPMGFTNVYGIAFDRVNNVMYGITSAAGGRKIFTINPKTGAGSLFASYPTTIDVGGGSFYREAAVKNPVPTVTSLSPNSVIVNAPTFTLTVNGTNFVSFSVVKLGSTTLATTYKSATQLTATISASLLTTIGQQSTTVFSPGPGGGTSNPLLFTVTTNPVPTLSSISPATIPVSSADTTITLTGKGFSAKATVQWNKVGLTTTYVSATSLKAVVPTSLLTALGTYPVTVTNPTPGGGISTAVNVTVGNPVPAIVSLSPSKGAVGVGITLTVNGTKFVKGATVLFGTATLTTTYVSATQLTATLPASLLTKAGTVAVKVTNPTPGGGTSAGMNFTIENPQPTLVSFTPSAATEGNPDTSLTVFGTGFVTGSVVKFGTTNLATTVVSATQLTAKIPASLLTTIGFPTIVVTNPTPGGGTSNLSYFMIFPATTSLSLITSPVPTVTRSGSTLVTTVRVTNKGTKAAYSVTLSSVTLNGVAATAVSPATAQTVAAGGTASFTVTFPGTAATTGAKVPLATTVTSLNASTVTGSVQVGPLP